mgnify:CR=1 FL=1
MVSEVQKKKLVHFFELLDSHKNGFLQSDDFSEIAERIRLGLGYEAGGEKHVFLAKKSAKFFHTLLNAISHENKQVISLQEWIDFIDTKIIHNDDEEYKEEFEELKTIADSKGFLLVSSSPLTRSSYHADEDFAALQINRINQTHAQSIS